MSLYEECSQLLYQGFDTMKCDMGSIFTMKPERFELLVEYCTELLKWQKRMNLVSKNAGLAEIIEKHFLDSLTLLPFLQGKNLHLLDVGSGAGFPGLVCKAALPQLSVTLLEPREKRVSFLCHTARRLKIEDDTKYGGSCIIEGIRLESGKSLYDRSERRFTHITSRAVADMTSFIEMVSGIMDSETTLLLMKGPTWHDELIAAEKTRVRYNYVIEKILEIRLPFSGGRRCILKGSLKK